VCPGAIGEVERDGLGTGGQGHELVLGAPGGEVGPIGAAGAARVRGLRLVDVIPGLLCNIFERDARGIRVR
jgi:hypothetical protein